jgi:hypothetical protein
LGLRRDRLPSRHSAIIEGLSVLSGHGRCGVEGFVSDVGALPTCMVRSAELNVTLLQFIGTLNLSALSTEEFRLLHDFLGKALPKTP